MECVATFLLFCVVALWIAAAASGRFSRRSRQRKLYTQLARQFNGQHFPGGFFSNPSLRLRYGDTWATVSESNVQGPFPGACLQVRIQWPHVGMHCELFTRTTSLASQTYVRNLPAVE